MSIEEQRQQVIDGIAPGDPDRAGKICRDGFEETGDAEFLYLLAVVKTEQNLPDGAVELFERADIGVAGPVNYVGYRCRASGRGLGPPALGSAAYHCRLALA